MAPVAPGAVSMVIRGYPNFRGAALVPVTLEYVAACDVVVVVVVVGPLLVMVIATHHYHAMAQKHHDLILYLHWRAWR